MDQKPEVKYSAQSGVFYKTSGESGAKIVIRIVRLPVVDIRTIRLEVADVDKVAVRVTGALSYAFPSETAELCGLLSRIALV